MLQKKLYLIIFLTIASIFQSFAQGIYREGLMKIYVMPFNIDFLDIDVGKPEGYLNDNYVRVEALFNISTTEISTIIKFKEVFFEYNIKDVIPKPRIFTRSFEYDQKYFEPSIVIDFIRCERVVGTIQINRLGFFTNGVSCVFKPDKQVIKLLEEFLPRNIVWFDTIED